MELVTKRKQIVTSLREVFDPELPVNIWDLGLIYGVNLSLVEDNWQATIVMTFTSPNCPSTEQIIGDIKSKLKTQNQIEDCKIEIVWDPPWSSNNLDEAMQLELGLF